MEKIEGAGSESAIGTATFVSSEGGSTDMADKMQLRLFIDEGGSQNYVCCGTKANWAAVERKYPGMSIPELKVANALVSYGIGCCIFEGMMAVIDVLVNWCCCLDLDIAATLVNGEPAQVDFLSLIESGQAGVGLSSVSVRTG
jgi:hypothetical protein